MIYGKIIHGTYPGIYYKKGKVLCSYGDAIQTLAVVNAYRQLGIVSGKDIMDTEVTRYRGEKLILPYSGYISPCRKISSFPISPDVQPAFYSFKHSLPKTLRSKLPNHFPIGCRDIHIRDILAAQGKMAYMSGCITSTFPKRKPTGEENKVFLVDIPDRLEPFIPPELKKSSEIIRHRYLADEPVNPFSLLEETKQLFSRYQKEAKLVVTSLFHAAVPCMAMGIPVVFVLLGNTDSRLSAVDPFLPVYTEETLPTIDWNPKPVEMEAVKKIMLQSFMDSLAGPQDTTNTMRELDQWFTQRQKTNHIDKPLKKIQLGMMYYTPRFAYFIRDEVMTQKPFRKKLNQTSKLTTSDKQ